MAYPDNRPSRKATRRGLQNTHDSVTGWRTAVGIESNTIGYELPVTISEGRLCQSLTQVQKDARAGYGNKTEG